MKLEPKDERNWFSALFVLAVILAVGLVTFCFKNVPHVTEFSVATGALAGIIAVSVRGGFGGLRMSLVYTLVFGITFIRYADTGGRLIDSFLLSLFTAMASFGTAAIILTVVLTTRTEGEN